MPVTYLETIWLFFDLAKFEIKVGLEIKFLRFFFQSNDCFAIPNNLRLCFTLGAKRRDENTEEAQLRRKQRAKKRKQQMQKQIEESKVQLSSL